MHLTEVTIQHVRGIATLRIKLKQNLRRQRQGGEPNSVGQWVVIAGPNGTGKTTILRSIAAVFMGPEVLPRMQIEPWQWISLGRERAKVALCVSESEDDDLPPGDQPAFSKEASQPNGVGAPTFGLTWTQQSTVMDLPRKRSHNFIYSRIWAFSPGDTLRGWMVVGLGASRTRSPSTTLAEDWLKGPVRRAALITLFRTDATLRLSLDWLTRQASQENMGNLVEKLVEPILASLGALVFDEPTPAKVDDSGIRLLRNASWVNVSECGLGAESLCLSTLEILRRMFDFFGPKFFDDATTSIPAAEPYLAGPVVQRTGIVLIDEAENHLHPRLQQRLGPWLRARFPNLQFIVTTHSPYIAQSADQLFVVGPRGAIEELTGNQLDRVVNGSVDDALTSQLFGLQNPYSLAAQAMRKRLGDIERRMQRGDATEAELAERRGLLAHLPSAVDHEVAQALRELRGEEE